MGGAAAGGQQGVDPDADLVGVGDRGGERQAHVAFGGRVLQAQGDAVTVHPERERAHQPAPGPRLDEAQQEGDQVGVGGGQVAQQ